MTLGTETLIIAVPTAWHWAVHGKQSIKGKITANLGQFGTIYLTVWSKDGKIFEGKMTVGKGCCRENGAAPRRRF